MANYRRTISKLQTAILGQGRAIRMNTFQFYSAEKRCMISTNILIEKQLVKNRKGEMVMKDVEIYKSVSMPDIVKFLADIYKAGG